MKKYIGKIFRQKAVVDYLSILSSKLFISLLTIVRGYVSAKVLGPVDYGTWKGMEISYKANGYLNLGVPNALSIEVPRLNGAGKTDEVEKVKSITLAQYFILPIPSIFVFLVFAFFLAEDYLLTASILIAVTMVVQNIHTFWHRLLSAELKFTSLAKRDFIVGIFSGAAPIALVLWLGKYGPYVSMLAISLLSLALMFGYKYYLIKPKFEWKLYLKLIKIGFPLMMVGAAFTLLTYTDRFLILSFLDVEQLGYYGITLMLISIFNEINNSVSSIFYPRISRRYGATEDINSLKEFLIKPAIISSNVASLISMIIILLLPLFVNNFLESYKTGVEAALIICLFNTVSGQTILHAINKHHYALYLIAIGIIINIFVSYLLLDMGFGISGVAIGTGAGLVFYRISLSLLSFYFISKKVINDIKWILLSVVSPIVVILFYYVNYILFAEHGFAYPAKMLLELFIFSIPLAYSFFWLKKWGYF